MDIAVICILCWGGGLCLLYVRKMQSVGQQLNQEPQTQSQLGGTGSCARKNLFLVDVNSSSKCVCVCVR